MDEQILKRVKEKVKGLPQSPGVYIMRDKTGKVIYVGKAKSLKNRVSSYFRAIDNHHPKVFQMVMNVNDFDYIVTDSEFEALVLECSLIKLHNPKYNILLKDDKGFSYVRIDSGEYPRITEVKMKSDDGATYIGPYLSGFVVKENVNEANKIFMIPTCTRKFPQDIGKGRPCLNFHLKQCMGVCKGRISKQEYMDTVNQAVDFIKGGSTEAIEKLTEKMNELSENMEFEKAARYRDRINAIGKIVQKQKLVSAKVANQDVIALVQGTNDTCAVVLKFRNEKLVDKVSFMLGVVDDITETLGEFLVRYYSDNLDIPPQITLNQDCTDRPLIEEFVTSKAKRKVNIIVPQRGEQLSLVKLASTNAAEDLSNPTQRTGKEVAALDELGKLLGLSKPPKYIEAYDISNIGSDTVVAGMIVFEDARPLRAAYKKFNIKTIVGTDDYGSMSEVMERRFNRYFEEKDTGKGFGRLPDLILLDGGKGHVGVITPIIERMGLQIPVFGMVKDDKHKTRAIAQNGGEIAISSHRSAFTLVSTIQEEVHRFSISFSRQKHQTNAFVLDLTKIEGIGDSRARELYKHFKTKKAIKEASLEDLLKAKGMTKATAKAVYEFFREGE